jgi:Cft2 family RNA processing exonuclease
VSADRSPISGQVTAIFTEAAHVIAARSGEPINPLGMDNPAAIRQVLQLLCGSAGLRKVVASAVGLLDDPLALSLVSDEPDIVAKGAEQVRGYLAAKRTARRREERHARQLDPAERANAREADKLTRLRTARDRAQAQADTARAEAATLRNQVQELSASVDELANRVEALRTQMRVERSSGREVTVLARSLAIAFDAAPAPTSHDPRGIGPGEPVRVDPTRHESPKRPDFTEALETGARTVGLPEALCVSATNWLPALLRALADPPRVTIGNVLVPRVEVLGGGHEIGGSCILVTAGGSRILIDAGTRPGGDDTESLAPPRIAEALASRIDAIVVTHAHNDHAGWVPALLAERPHTPIFASQATADLLATMWMDSAKILGRRSEGTENRPAYTHEDARYALSRIETLDVGVRRRVGELEFELFPAGHILGAVGVILHAGSQRVVVSGDVSGPGQRTVGGIQIPDAAVGADLLVLESTYAGMSRPVPRRHAADAFIRDVTAVLDRGGRVLVPAFALGRAQEIALLCSEHLPGAEVIIDGLARAISRVYQSHVGPDGRLMQIFGDRVRAAPYGGTQSEITMLRSGVVITTSGMLTAGPAIAWARAILPDPRSGLMVVGYQDEDSPGRRLLALAETGGGLFELPGTDDSAPEEVKVAAHVADYKLGAHASADELVAITAKIAARAVMLVHGETPGQRQLRERLGLRGQSTVDTLAWTSS